MERSTNNEAWVDDLTAQFPRAARPLVAAIVHRDAVDSIVRVDETPGSFFNTRLMIREAPAPHVLMSRIPGRPLFSFSGPSEAGVWPRLQALLAALGSANLRPVHPKTAGTARPAALPGWTGYAVALSTAASWLRITLYSLSGPALQANGELAPLLWRGKHDGYVDYTGAQITITSGHASFVLRLGEAPGSSAAILKALQASERNRGATANFFAPGRRLHDLPHLISGEVPRLLTGVVDLDRAPLTHLDVVVPERLAGAARARLQGVPDVTVHAVDDALFAALQSRSQTIVTQRGTVRLGPPVNAPARRAPRHARVVVTA